MVIIFISYELLNEAISLLEILCVVGIDKKGWLEARLPARFSSWKIVLTSNEFDYVEIFYLNLMKHFYCKSPHFNIEPGVRKNPP